MNAVRISIPGDSSHSVTVDKTLITAAPFKLKLNIGLDPEDAIGASLTLKLVADQANFKPFTAYTSADGLSYQFVDANTINVGVTGVYSGMSITLELQFLSSIAFHLTISLDTPAGVPCNSEIVFFK